MNAFLIVLFCYSFSLGPAMMFQPTHSLAKCNATAWLEECGHTAATVKIKSCDGDPWGREGHIKLAKKPAMDSGRQIKPHSVNLFHIKWERDPWGEIA